MNSVYEKITNGYYRNNDPLPQKPKPVPTLASNATPDQIRAYADLVEAYNDSNFAYNFQWEAWRKKHAENQSKFQDDLEQEFGTSGHPKASNLFSLAWDYGHSSGLHEVYAYYNDMVDLLDL
jgi:hypothetical protein